MWEGTIVGHRACVSRVGELGENSLWKVFEARCWPVRSHPPAGPRRLWAAIGAKRSRSPLPAVAAGRDPQRNGANAHTKGGLQTFTVAANWSCIGAGSRHSTHDERGHHAELSQAGCEPSLQDHRDTTNGRFFDQPYTQTETSWVLPGGYYHVNVMSTLEWTKGGRNRGS